ncbi:MAG: acyltransferase [Methanomicrobiaceae archaeon]|nr:acyltransferase [Methanomicrobiaceae archaeon]
MWIPEFDYMRGLAIIAVVAIHVSMALPLIDVVTALGTLNMLLSFVLLQFAVPMFIFITGFVLSLRYSGRFSTAAFYRRRLATILPPYLLFTFVYMVLPPGLTAYIWPAKAASVQTFIIDLLTGTAHYHLWFFVLIIQLYLIYPLIAAMYGVCAEYEQEYPLLGAVLALQILWSTGIIAGGVDLLWHSVTGSMFPEYVYFPEYIFYFIAGIHVHHNFDRFREAVHRVSGIKILFASAVTAGALSLLLIAGTIRYGTFNGISGMYSLFETVAEPFYYVTIIALAFIVAEWLTASKNAASQLLKTTGDYSFGIYLIHPLFLLLGTEVLARVFFIDWYDWIFYPANFLFTFGVSYVMVLLLSHLPWSGLILGTRAQRAKDRQ